MAGGVCILINTEYASTSALTETNGAANFMVSTGALIMIGTEILNIFGIICATGQKEEEDITTL